MAAGAARDAARGRAAVTAQDKLLWLEAVTLDKRASSALRVANLLALKYLNRESGEAWPSLETIARDLGVDRRTASRAVELLTRLSYLAKDKGGGRGVANRYRLRRPDDNGDEFVLETRTNSSRKQRRECPTNPREEPEEGTRRAGGAKTTPFEAFEAAWAWNNADSRIAARRLFETLGEADRAEAMRCVAAYLADCARERRKQCHAKTYLAERRWEGFSASPAGAATVERKVVIYTGAPQWEAWTKHRGTSFPTKEFRQPDGRFRSGWTAPSEWPPGYAPGPSEREGGLKS